MDNSMVKDVEELTKRGLVVEVDGKKYSTEKLTRILDKPQPSTLKLSSLLSFVEYVNKKIDESDASKLVVIVEDRSKVSLVSHLDKENMGRSNFVTAINPNEDRFNFGQWIEHEDFIIKLRSLFKQTADRDKIIQFLSRVSDKAEVSVEDDGVTQKVTVNKGISGAIKENEKAPSIVKLSPYRTFLEIEQPESEFLFRLKSYGQKDIHCALYESDGGAWKIEAVKRIAEWISVKLKGATILH